MNSESTLSKLAKERVRSMSEKRSMVCIVQGEIIGELKPFNMDEYRILSLSIGGEEEQRILVDLSIVNQLDKIEDEIELIQCVGLYDSSSNLIITLDLIVLTKNKEIVFQGT